ncbi:telomere repeat-binding factor 4-like isoform X2 [Brassica napus]|uniref:telomere repeat-binding factor 4-like isoform X2 n=1 Tax=Brassica napus TaxID=3708 RepID=UPI002078816D|nr:telomere repeat-binding factor 4-like isoform X2 [Brassica napus]
MFFTLAYVSPTAATATPPPYANSSSSSPATSLPHSASSDFSIDNFVVDNKNALRYDAMIFEAISELADPNGSDVGSIFSFIEPSHEVPPTFRRVLSSRLRRLAAQGKLPKLLNFYKLPDGSETTNRTTPAPTPKPKETNTKPRHSYINQPPLVSQEMIDEAAITGACKVVEAENKINIAKAAVEE